MAESVAHSIVGTSRANSKREENDFYPTPSPITQALLDREDFHGLTWECACGDGSMSEVLADNGLIVYSTDLIDRDYSDVPPCNFLETHYDCNNIITNPPFKYAKEFVLHAKVNASNKIAFLLKTVFLEGKTRYEMFQDKEFPLARMYQFSGRLPIYKNGIKVGGSGMIAFAWFVWDRNYEGNAPEIYWINDESCYK